MAMKIANAEVSRFEVLCFNFEDLCLFDLCHSLCCILIGCFLWSNNEGLFIRQEVISYHVSFDTVYWESKAFFLPEVWSYCRCYRKIRILVIFWKSSSGQHIEIVDEDNSILPLRLWCSPCSPRPSRTYTHSPWRAWRRRSVRSCRPRTCWICLVCAWPPRSRPRCPARRRP